MPYDATLVGQSTEPIRHEVDARWIMSYAAGLNDFNPAYLGADRAKVVAHPLFPVCLEWPTILSSRHMPGYDTLTPAEAARSVHAARELGPAPRSPPGSTPAAPTANWWRALGNSASPEGSPSTAQAGRPNRRRPARHCHRLGANPSASPSPLRSTPPMFTRSARASGTPSTPTAGWRWRLACRTASCTARRPWRWRSPGWWMSSLMGSPAECDASAATSGPWC